MMNKRIKRTIALAITISAFFTIEPTQYSNFMSTKAYAAVKGAELEKVSLGQGDINFKASQTEYTLQLSTSVEELRVGATPKEDSAQVEINGKDVDESDNYSTVVSLDKGENKVIITVTNGSKKKTYTITVMRGQIDDTQIYLSDLKLSSGQMDFSKDKTSYDVNVPSDTEDISIKAIPDDNDYDVEIGGVTAYEDQNYKRTVSLDNGANKIDIRIQDDDDHEKIYTLHINRGATNTITNTQNNNSSTNTETNGTSSSTSTEASSTTTKATTASTVVNQGWVLNNGQWSYLNQDGKKATGWKIINGAWYYLDTNGAMKTGWQQVNGEWYYLDLTGAMKTGWFKNSDGKWYYLNDSGIMAKNTIIGKYRLDANGVWIN